MAINIKSFLQGLRIFPKSGSTISVQGEMEVDSATSKLNFHNGTTASPMVTEAHSATLTNKTIDGASNTLTVRAASDITGTLPVANGGTNSSTALNNNRIIQSSSGAIAEAAAITASRALASDTNGIPTHATTTTTELNYVSGVTSAIQTQLDAKTAKATLTTTGDMYYASSASTPARLALGSANQVLKSVNGIPTWVTLSAGGINYVASNPDAEVDTTGWATYADAAGAQPVNGTGGSPNSTLTRTTSSPLRGSGSFLFTKSSGASRQGEGASFDFTIDEADKYSMLGISFDYEIASGTYVDGDLTVYIYDVTNSTVIQPAGYSISNVGVESKHQATFQATGSTSYRLILHVAVSTDSSNTVKFDNVIVGPQIKSIGPAMTDWVSYSPTFTGFGTVASSAFYSRRVGDKLEVRGRLVAGTTTATEARISLGYNGANNNVTIGSNVNTTEVVGPGYYDINASIGIAVLAEPSVAYLTFGIQDGTHSGLTKVNANVLVGTGSGMSFFASVPIVGWSSNVVMSADADTRVVAARYSSSSSQSIPDSVVTPVDFATKEYDTHGMFTAGVSYNSGAGTWSTNPKITIPVPGKYQFRLYMLTNGEAWTATNTHNTRLYKNGSLVSYFQYNAVQATVTTNMLDTGAATVEAVAGDVFDIRYSHNRGGAVVMQNSGTHVWVEVQRLSGPAQIAASESVNARYYASSTTITASLATIVWSTKDFDSHDAMSSGVYTVPVSGKYQVNVGLAFNFTQISNNDDQIEVQKNGTAVFSYIDFGHTGGPGAKGYTLGGLVSCNAGDTIRVQALSNQTTPTIRSSNLWNYVSIARVGN